MANQSESEMESMTADSFEHALDNLYGLSTQPPPGEFGAIEEPWFDEPTHLLHAPEPTRLLHAPEPTRLLHAHESTRLDAAALFEGLHVAAPSAASEEIGLLSNAASATARRRAAPTVHTRPAPPVPHESRIALIALAGAFALVGLLAVWSHFHP
jgi:hypothetical protein